MDSDYTLLNNTTCWVYLFQNTGEYTLRVGYSLHLSRELKRQQPGFRLLYYRRFHNIIDGLGHKLLLDQLSADSLRRIVQKRNPRGKDLKRELFRFHSII